MLTQLARSILPLIAITAFASAAQGQVLVDISKITCDQYVAYRVTNPKNISIWLNGYYNAKGNKTVIDAQAFDQGMEKLRDYCLVNQKEMVMQAAEKLFVGK
jgi:hypothetical protein